MASRLAARWAMSVPRWLAERARTIGRSVESRAVHALTFGHGGPARLILGGFHGDEPKSVYAVRRLCEHLHEQAASDAGRRIVVVPVVNPDGYSRRRRKNARGVDLNRNFPTGNWTALPARSRFHGGTRPAAEPETRAVLSLIESVAPGEIISVHSINRHRHCNNYDGPARELAGSMAACNGYPLTTTMGYPTPGSFGTWAGVERSIPTVTLELPSHHSPRRCWEDNCAALLAGLAG